MQEVSKENTQMTDEGRHFLPMPLRVECECGDELGVKYGTMTSETMNRKQRVTRYHAAYICNDELHSFQPPPWDASLLTRDERGTMPRTKILKI